VPLAQTKTELNKTTRIRITFSSTHPLDRKERC